MCVEQNLLVLQYVYKNFKNSAYIVINIRKLACTLLLHVHKLATGINYNPSNMYNYLLVL